MSSLSPKISDDLFFSHRLFSCFNMLVFRKGGQIRSPHRLGGPKSLHLHKFTILPLLLLPPRGAKLHCQLRWGGSWPDLPPLDPQLTASEEISQGPYVVARAGFEPATLRTKSCESKLATTPH